MDVDKIIEELKLAEYYPHNISIFGRAADCIKTLQAQLDEKIINAFNNGECPFPHECKHRYTCIDKSCNADTCSNGHAYRFS